VNEENELRKTVNIFVIVLVFWGSISPGSQIVINADKPLNGEWKHNLSKVWETSSAGSQVLVKVGSINIDEKGNIYCVDRKHQKIFVFKPDGQFAYTIGSIGEGPGNTKALIISIFGMIKLLFRIKCNFIIFQKKESIWRPGIIRKDISGH